MKPAGIYVEIRIRASLDRVWELTQNPDLHPRWDARFSRITPLEDLDGGGSRFRYELRLPGMTLAGLGTSIGECLRPDGTRTSALKFAPDNRISPLGPGRGYWRYVPDGDHIVFVTGYDYRGNWGSLLDRLILRRVIGWLTAWSFDRLRLWAEGDVAPERWPLWSVLAWWRSDRPRAARCIRRPRHAHAMSDAPATLSTLATP